MRTSQVFKVIFNFKQLCQYPGSIVYPRPAIPKVIAEDLISKVPNVVLATNPCRIQLYTQEIAVYREDIVSKMSRNCVYFPENGETSEHFARTILAQGHLAPLPLAR